MNHTDFGDLQTFLPVQLAGQNVPSSSEIPQYLPDGLTPDFEVTPMVPRQ